MDIKHQNAESTQNLVDINVSKTLVIELPASLSGIEAMTFKHKFQSIVDELGQLPPISLDFSKNNFLDSCAIGSIAYIIKTCKTESIDIHAIGVNEKVMSVLKMTGLNRLLSINPE